MPSFAQYWEGADKTPLYRQFADLARTAAWFRGDPVGRPYILKAPQFLQDLPTLARTFPDARFIRLERDPARVVASSASLVWNQMRIQSDRADPMDRKMAPKDQPREEVPRRADPGAYAAARRI